MNKFITRANPLTPKRNKKPETSKPTENQENQQNPVNNVPEKAKKVEEPSIMEKLHLAIREDDAQFTFDILSKNRPFDQAMNKTMTKIEFSPSFATSEFMLLSVDESVVGAFYEGQALTIRGESTDDAVLCTNQNTFPIKVIESATTVLLMENILEPPTSPTEPKFDVHLVDGKCFSTAELCPPNDTLNIGRLKDLLREQELRWDWKKREVEEKVKGFRLAELLDVVQMSMGEVKTALEDLPVVRWNGGRMRFLSHKFRGEFMGQIVELIDDGGDVALEKMTFSSLRSHLPENIPDDVIHWFLSSKCKKTSEDNVFSLPEDTLIRELTVVILYGVQKMSLEQFGELLSKILPFGVKVDFNEQHVFEGIADISDAPFGKVITYLAPEDLPDGIKDRMNYLFAHRKLWSMEQLRPYFNDLYKSKVAFDKFVVQNCNYTLSETNEMLYCGVRM